MVEIMTREASSCDLKELVGKFIPEAIGELPSIKLPRDLGRAELVHDLSHHKTA